MTSLECARAAFAALCENSPANHCRVLESSVLDAGKEVPGGWSSARTLTEGLYGGKAIVNVSQQRLGEEQVPTVEILCDDPVLAAGSFAIRDGLVGLREADGAWALAYGESAGGARGNVALAAPASLCAVVVEAAPRRCPGRYPTSWSRACRRRTSCGGGAAARWCSPLWMGRRSAPPTAPPSPPTECAASGSGARAPIWRSSPGTGTPSACACTAWRTERPTARGDKCQTPESGCNSSCKAAVRMYLDVLYAVSQQRV